MNLPWCRQLQHLLEQPLPRHRLAFEEAQSRREALRPFVTLADAARAAARTRNQVRRDGIVAALVAEYRATPSALWSTALLAAMAPALASIARGLELRLEKKDARSTVQLAFLEGVKRIATEDRIAFRLYSETRRRVLRHRRTRIEDAATPCSVDVAKLAHKTPLCIEALLDVVRFARRARTFPPAAGERPTEYVERIDPSRTRPERLTRLGLLRTQRAATLAALHYRLRTLSPTLAEETP